jgi:hypothetical protein
VSLSQTAPDFAWDLEAIATQARGVFSTSSELCAWLTCALHLQDQGGDGRPRAACDEISAAACAVRFSRRCHRASTPREFARVVVTLPTPQLEALLALKETANL